MKKGFTLVELSIVLIIIGLLVGGILIGQSLIGSAKINRLVSDLRQYEIAINNFKTKFKFYPGDSPQFTPAGSGDKIIFLGENGLPGNCSTANPVYSKLERYQVWGHLTQAQMLSKRYLPYSPNMCGGPHSDDYSIAVNQSKISPVVELDDKAMTHVWEGNQKMYPIQADKQLANDNFALFFYVLPKDMLAIENKMSGASFTNKRQVGMVNYDGLGNCKDPSDTTVLCTATTAVVGSVGYFLSPL